MNSILLENMKFHAFHGVLPEERMVGNAYSVTVRFAFDFSKAAREDDLDETINYAEVYELVKSEMQQASKLIEHVAQRISDRILDRFPQIKSLEVQLSKHNPPVSGEVERATVVHFYPEQA
ncbi:MAG: dihydroneopterin aldolase [Prevotellaceae bacterium]|nr:dihydroneopterin aldolase [Prevotellaceae bacterium]